MSRSKHRLINWGEELKLNVLSGSLNRIMYRRKSTILNSILENRYGAISERINLCTDANKTIRNKQ